MSHQRTIPELISTAKALKTKAEQANEKSEQFYVSLGLTLAELKERKPKGYTWAVLVKKHFGYSQHRADELIRIGTGTTTMEETRGRKKASMKKSREKNSVPRGTEIVFTDGDGVPASAREIREAKKMLKEVEGLPLNEQIGRLATELSDYITDWTVRANALWDSHPEMDRAGQDCLVQFVLTSTDRLQRLAQSLDDRRPRKKATAA